MSCLCSKPRELYRKKPDPKPGPKPKPDPDPPECQGGLCSATKTNLHEMFPGLKVRPRPQPDPAMKDGYDAWLQEYGQWGALKCPCNRGYFCRVHGSWISGEEVGSGIAAPSDQQNQDSCPSYHYKDYAGVTSHIGERDA